MRRRRGRSPESPAAGSSRREAGFTLVEVLVVMLVMGILMGIAIPSFLGQRTRADDTSSKSGARAAAAAIENYASEHLGSYAGATNTILNSMDSSIPSNTTVEYWANCSPTYCWRITTPYNSSTGTAFQLAKEADGDIVSDCDINQNTSGMQHGAGGCPSDGHWGVD
jgi:prepilin-type N-terminal cleavage/methylation domain-containing protein